jgi:hypothetical protein
MPLAVRSIINLIEQFESHLNQVMQSIENVKVGKKEKLERSKSSDQTLVDNAVARPNPKKNFTFLISGLPEPLRV